MNNGFVVAGTSSGSGKTTVTMALMAYLIRRGFKVAPFKVGPDFIDPGHHTRITGTISRNLDGWMLPKAYNLACFKNHAAGRISVVEGVMGLFDGYDGKTEAGSTAQMAKWIGLPVILVVNARSMARSAAALVQGFERFDPDLIFAGVIFNNLGSERHLTYLKDALAGNVTMPLLGGIVRDEMISIPERHLGLVTSDDHFLSDDHIRRLADLIENNINVDKLESSFSGFFPERGSIHSPGASAGSKENVPSVRIGVARDRAFCFYYQDNLDMLEAADAKLIFFSPLEDQQLPEDLDGIYIGGGYPELFAEQLAGNKEMRCRIRQKSMDGMPIYGECGGFMYLCTDIRDKEGKTWPMTGCLPFSTRMLSRLKALGYREIELAKETIIGKKGETVRGHEFHYSEIADPQTIHMLETVYHVTHRMGMRKTSEGYLIGRTLGSYVHLHFGSRPEVSGAFVNACLKYRHEGTNIA